MSAERNLCHESGCTSNPSCCINTRLENVTSSEIKQYFPNAIPFRWFPPSEEGVYFTERNPLTEDDKYSVTINGACPMLTPEGNCTGGLKDKPNACKDTKIGSKVCNSFRRRDGRRSLSHK